jgi:regulator of protease activity HflC (stomatin/prohibitin superfamily)
MYQALIEKFADVLFPLICGAIVWFLLHYTVLTPRIVKVESPNIYDALITNQTDLPDKVHQCLKSNIADTILMSGRWEASLYTASLKHISVPFKQRYQDGLQALDERCGTSKAIEEAIALQQQKAALEAQKRQQRLAAQKRQYELELEKQRQRAINEANRQRLKLFKDALSALFGE